MGATDDTVRHLVERERWTRVGRSVYRVNGAPEAWEGRVMAACLAAGAGALASHRSAAAVWGLEGFEPPRVVDVTVDRRRGPQVTGARVHRSRDHALAGATVRRRIPVTGVDRTILDLCAGERNPQVALRALDSARYQRLVTPKELRACLGKHRRQGRRGVALFAELLERRLGLGAPESPLEADLLDLLLAAGLPAPRLGFEVVAGGRRYRIDLAYPAEKVAIECDGRRSRLNERNFETDPVRENALKLEGWLVLRFTRRRVTEEPGAVVDEVRRALTLRQAPAPAAPQSSGLASS